MDRTFISRVDARTTQELVDVGSEKWRRGPETIGAGIAEHDLGLAPPIVDVLHHMADTGQTGYLYPEIYENFRSATASFVERRYGWPISSSQVRMVPDVITVLDVIMQDLLPAGSGVVVPTPAYMPFLGEHIPGRGHQLITLPMLREPAWHYDLDALDKVLADGARLLVLCNPHNPIGRVLTREELLAIHEVVKRHDVLVFSDEIHAPITYSGHQHTPFASLNDDAASRTITSTAASKAFNVPGLKCAQTIITNSDLMQRWDRQGWFAGGRTATTGVLATTAAYNEGDEWLANALGFLERNRDELTKMVAEQLPQARFQPAEGTFLAWLDFAGQLGDEIAGQGLAEYLFAEAKVHVNDGALSDPTAPCAIRVNFATPLPILRELVSRVSGAVN